MHRCWMNMGAPPIAGTRSRPVTNYYVLPIPPGTPPGTYTITAQLYNARDVLADEIVGTVDVAAPLRHNRSVSYAGRL